MTEFFYKFKKYFFLYILLVIPAFIFSQTHLKISVEPATDSFPLFTHNSISTIAISKNEHAGVKRVIDHLQQDLLNVSGKKCTIRTNNNKAPEGLIIGTIGFNPAIDSLINSGQLDASKIRDQRESFIIQVLIPHGKDSEKIMVIAGSDKRGTIYGIYHLSERLGVSPWYWWADVPVKKQNEAYLSGRFISSEPVVEYRGIFINDEAPALSGWVEENYGGFNAQFYDKVFELILRLKGNFLWPAMWGRAFYDDDPQNPVLADEYGIIIGTSHHEPMMRAHVEWQRYGSGPWNYEKNKSELQKFWTEGIKRMDDFESIVTVGMRGDGDEAMTEGTAIKLLETIIKDQREIIESITGESAEKTPQAWALYKEVQDYYDKGMRVPEDVLLLLCDDNWGNIRMLPSKKEWGRKGGFGIYYHYDFVGGPVSYRWLNVTQIEKVWEQMNLAYSWNAKKLWLVNVGDIKPMEFPISFFLDFAWNPQKIRAQDLPAYYRKWSKQQFGEKFADEIADILAGYTKYNARRTPEMLSPATYSLVNYHEAETVVNDYNKLVKKSKQIYDKLPESYKDAFYQLVLFPVEICANLNEMYVAAGRNRLYAKQERASTNMYAKKVMELFKKDKELTDYYHNVLSDGKWNHFMSQTHIGYTSWDNPTENIMPEVKKYTPLKKAGLGIMVEGSEEDGDGRLPVFDLLNDQRYYFEIFNKGAASLKYKIEPKQDWIQLSQKEGSVRYKDRIYVNIDWENAPKGKHHGEIIISGSGERYTVNITILNKNITARGFIENNGVVSFNAANYLNAVNTDKVNWITVPNLGRSHSAITVSPPDADPQTPGNDSPYLEYEFTLFNHGDIDIRIYLSPTLNYKKEEGLKFAVSVDDKKPQIINMHKGETKPDWEYPQWWNQSVTDHIKIKNYQTSVEKTGIHTLKIWMIDPGIVFQKIVIDAGGLKPSYLGPPESKFIMSAD